MHLPSTGAALDDAFLGSIRADLDARRSVAVVDLSFEQSYPEQKAFANGLLTSGLASRLDAYSAWNTDANTTGTALAEAIAAGAGRRLHTYDALAHQTFTFLRFVDDVDFHDDVRPALNDWLTAQGITDHTLLAPDLAAQTAERNRALLWYEAQTTLAQLYPQLHIAAMSITLPVGSHLRDRSRRSFGAEPLVLALAQFDEHAAGRFGMKERDQVSVRTFAWTLVDQANTFGFIVR